jgi:hypothetical protein
MGYCKEAVVLSATRSSGGICLGPQNKERNLFVTPSLFSFSSFVGSRLSTASFWICSLFLSRSSCEGKVGIVEFMSEMSPVLDKGDFIPLTVLDELFF